MTWSDELVADVVDRLVGHPLLEEMIERRVAAALEERGRRDWLTTAEAAERLGVTPEAIRMAVSRGRFEAKHVGRRLYVSAASVDDVSERSYAPPVHEHQSPGTAVTVRGAATGGESQ